ncbi:MAG: hypothetical protein ACXACD_11385 [Candidatus Thorarchaeota archaeon]|jgi:hypothetical protein
MPSDDKRQAVARVAARLQQNSNLTHTEARKIVERSLERAARKKGE